MNAAAVSYCCQPLTRPCQIESASRVHLAFAANRPEAVLFRGLLRGMLPRPT